MAELPEPQEHEIAAAKKPHDLFLSNLIMNHMLLFAALAAFGQSYIKFMVLVPILSISTLAYTFYRSSTIKREDSEFVYIHWQIARRWSKLFSGVLTLLAIVATFGVLAHQHLGLMKEAVYGIIGGLGILPTLLSTLVLIVIESDSLHHAKEGKLPKWAQQRFLDREG